MAVASAAGTASGCSAVVCCAVVSGFSPVTGRSSAFLVSCAADSGSSSAAAVSCATDSGSSFAAAVSCAADPEASSSSGRSAASGCFTVSTASVA